MGIALTNEGHRNGMVDSSGNAHGTAGSGRMGTDWSDNGTSGGTSNPEAGGVIKITTLALATNPPPILTAPGTGVFAALLPTPREKKIQIQSTNTATQPQGRLKMGPPMTLATRTE